MRFQKSPRNIVEQSYKAAPRSLKSNTNEEDDSDFRDFIESVSVTQDELAAIVSMSESSSIH